MKDTEYNVVVDSLQKMHDHLWKMTQSNMNMSMFNVMDQIRLDQIDQLKKAIDWFTKGNEGAMDMFEAITKRAARHYHGDAQSEREAKLLVMIALQSLREVDPNAYDEIKQYYE